MKNFKTSGWKILILLFHFQLLYHFGVTVEETSHPKRLSEHLLRNYGSRFVRPVKNYSSVVDVYFRAKPIWFADFDEAKQILSFVAANQFKWKDEYLTWDPDDYGGIKEMTFGKNEIWFPDVTPFERVDTGSADANMEETFPIVDYQGNVVYYNLMVLSTFCKMDVRLFPYDSHGCLIRFSSYSFEGDAVSLYYTNDSDSTENILTKNGVWSVTGYVGEQKEIKYLCCPEPYKEVYFTMYIQRESRFYVLNIGVPTALLSLTTLSVFLLHPESGEKISLCVNNVLALIIFQQLLSMNMPPTGDQTPIVAYYFVVVITISFLSVLTTCLTLFIYHNKGHRPPPKLLKWFLFIGGTSGRRVIDSSRQLWTYQNNGFAGPPGDSGEQAVPPTREGSVSCEAAVNTAPYTRRSSAVKRSVKKKASISEDTSPQPAFESEWVKAAIRLDMFFFAISLTAMIIGFVYSFFLFVREWPNHSV